MEKLFAAMQEQHPGYELLDVRLLANQNEANNQDLSQLDEQFAVAVNAAVDLDLGTLQ
jgi:hypothetical protein